MAFDRGLSVLTCLILAFILVLKEPLHRILYPCSCRWISNYHEHETLLQENEEERLSKEEQDMAWEVFRKSLEWEEVQRVTVDESISERKPASMSNLTPPAPETSSVTQPRGILRSHVVIRKCTNLSHKLTLRSQGTKPGCSTVCGECAQEISWENCKVAR